MNAKITRRPALLGLVATAAVLLTACGGSGGGTAPAAAGDTGAAAGAGNGAGGRNGAGPPGVTGKIAEASKGTLQVQDTDAQTTVTYTASTRFTQTVGATVKVGDCVTAVGTPVSGSTDALTANSVVILATQNGDCTLGNRPGGPRGSGAPTGIPRPTGTAGGGQGRQGGGGQGNGQAFATAIGKVTSVSGKTVMISGVLREGGRFGGGNGSSAPATPSSPPASPTPKPVTVTLAAAATVTTTAAATSAAATVGKCAFAVGKADDSGTVAATSITISTAGANGCTRFGGGFGGRRGGNGG
jgi:hypothetical protein